MVTGIVTEFIFKWQHVSAMSIGDTSQATFRSLRLYNNNIVFTRGIPSANRNTKYQIEIKT